MTDQAPLSLHPTAGGRWSAMESSWSRWEPSSLARPQPTPSLWTSWVNHCLPGNTWPLPLDPGTNLLELRGHPESGTIPLYWWDNTGTSFSRDSFGVKSGPTPLDSSNPAHFLLSSLVLPWMVGEILTSQRNFPPSLTLDFAIPGTHGYRGSDSLRRKD